MDARTSSPNYRWLLWAVFFTVLAADQLTKTLVIQSLAIGDSWRPWAGTPILEWFALTHIKNTGAAMGLLPSGGILFAVVAIVVSLGIVWHYRRLPKERWWIFLSLGLMMGGAIGNLIDRVRLGWVTDFIHVGSFYIFNIADSAVVVGVILLAWEMWQEDERQRRQQEAVATAETQVAQTEVVQRPRGARAYTLPERNVASEPLLKRSGGARVYDAPNHNGKARLEHTVIYHGMERLDDDVRN